MISIFNTTRALLCAALLAFGMSACSDTHKDDTTRSLTISLKADASEFSRVNIAGNKVDGFTANWQAGDQIGMTFSGSFPALNIAALVSAEVYGLQICAMTGIGASYCGANDPRFTFFEMQNYLCDIGLLTHRIDYVSWGGNDDILKDVNAYEDEAKPHLQRIQSVIDNSTATYIREANFDANIDLRISYFQQDIPQIKMFINVGGSMAGVGTGLNVYQQTGYSKGGMVYSSNKRAHNQGLLQYYKACGLPVVNMLNIRQLAHTYNVPFADDNMEVAPQIGLTDYNKQNQYYSFYYQKAYNPVYAVVALLLSVGLAIFYARYRKNYAPTQQHESYNHIMRNHH